MLIPLLKRLFRQIDTERRFQLLGILILTIFSSIFEIISLGSVVPFVGLITNSSASGNYNELPYFSELIKLSRDWNIPIAIATASIFIVAALITGLIRLSLLRSSIKVSNMIGHDLSREVFYRTLLQPYQVHIARNSSEIVSSLTQKIATTTSCINALLNIFTSMVLLFAVMATLILINPAVSGGAIFIFSCVYGLIIYRTKSRLRENSVYIAENQSLAIKYLHEGLGCIRDILLDCSQLVYVNRYSRAILKLQESTSKVQFILLAPRFVMESSALILFGIMAIAMDIMGKNISLFIPAIAAVALGAQRVLPLAQQAYGSLALVMGSYQSVLDVVVFLEQKTVDDSKNFSDPVLAPSEFKFQNVEFRYNSESFLILKNINLTIYSGERIGLIGQTGCGKSTFADLLMGLLVPTSGKIFLDNLQVNLSSQLSLQRLVAHVPQSIFLIDSTVAENIAIGQPKELIDYQLLKSVASIAQLDDFISSSPGGWETLVGERGVMLSGGQRQRIGIARALYKQPNLLVLDEATNALDNDTELRVVDALRELNEKLTIVIIAHRLSTLKMCDRIFEIKDHQVIEVSPKDVLIDNFFRN